MDVREFQKSVTLLKKKLGWTKLHQPKELLLGMTEEIGEFRNLIKWEFDHEKVQETLLGNCKKNLEKTKHNQITSKQIKQLYYLASLNGKLNTSIGDDATTWIKQQAKTNDIKSMTEESANCLISKLIRKEVVDFFGDMLWYLGSLADYCQIDFSIAMEQVIKDIESRYVEKNVKGKTAGIVAGEYDGKYF